ncbi:hypothetical protein [Microbacterium aurum]|uniref:hypothetical protein n=1 Tax=Microbacterium aurum TaxID=36805 RepID=UPI00248D6182|nr:hypothetical protein [Microbacterium aurum]
MGRMAEGRWRLTAHAAAVMLALAALTACTPDPTPTPSPTGFASDEEAFAAAEDTYRAYIDASNAQREDPDSLPSPTDFLTGDALTESIAATQQLNDAGLELEGPMSIVSVRGDDWDPSTATISVCMNYSDTRVVDKSGNDVTPESRSDVGSLKVQVIYASPTPLIAQSIVGDEQC